MAAPVYDTGQAPGRSQGLGGQSDAPTTWTTQYYSLQNQSASGNAFRLTGGIYLLECTATFGGGSVTLQKVGPDGVTLVNAATPFTTNGTQTAYLPLGQYQWTVATATAVYTQLARVPLA